MRITNIQIPIPIDFYFVLIKVKKGDGGCNVGYKYKRHFPQLRPMNRKDNATDLDGRKPLLR